MVNTRSRTKKIQSCFSQASLEDSNHQSTHSEAIIGSNDDLLTEILIRLPATSILRFKSVSKHWRLLLSHTSFTHRYDNLLKSPGLFATAISDSVGAEYVPFDVENPSTPFRSFDFYFNRCGVEIVQSCNGLLLCCDDGGSSGYKGEYYVFNPTTKQLALIPPVPGGLKVRKTIHFMGLAFHQTDRAHYKLVCILRTFESMPNRESFQIQVYSSETGKWKISVESFSSWRPMFFCRGVYLNGAFYWAPNYLNRGYFYFKIDDEQMQPLPMPIGLKSSKIVTYFGESRGHLHLILFSELQHNCSCLNVYEMLSDRSGWFVKYQIQLDQFVGAYISTDDYEYNVIDVVRCEKEEDTFMVLITPENIIIYNVHDKGIKQIYSSTWYFYEYNPWCHRYTETLSSF